MVPRSLILLLLAKTTYGRLETSTFVIQTRFTPRKGQYRSNSVLFYVQESIPRNESIKSSNSKVDHVETKPDQDNEMWMQATRTLGSLFLHQEDAVRNTHDGNKTNVDESAPFPFHESTLSAYLLNLKRQEEDNREKSSRKAQTKTNAEKRETRQLSNEFQVDQVGSVNQYLYSFLPSCFIFLFHNHFVLILNRNKPKN